MKKRQMHVKCLLAASTLMPFCFGTPASAQSTPPAQSSRPVQDNDVTRQEMARFDQFLDNHREIADQLRKDPSLVDNPEYLKNHPELQTYLQDHPAVREAIKQNPNAFMHAEERFDRRDDNRDDINRRELANFDQFLDSHREIADQLRRDPSLVDNPEYVKNHPELQTYLQDHPEAREAIKQNPNAFMHAEERFDRRDDGRDDTNRRELANFDQFLDSHREIAEQLRKDPSLVDNHEFVKNHPALQTYLQDHPAVHDAIKQDPNAFMHAEQRFDRREDGRDINHEELARFNQFLDSHREIAERLRKDPSLVDNQEFVKSHPALQTYLHDHPGVRDEVKADPNAFMQEEARLHRDDMYRDDHDSNHGRFASFGEFLDNHSKIAQQLSQDPSLVKNQEYLEGHPELKDYLNSHPEVRQELMNNPEGFVKSAQQFSTKTGQTPTKNPTANPKPNQ